MNQINLGVIGAGWVGGIRANACAANPLVDELHIAEIDPARAAEIGAQAGAARVTADWTEIIGSPQIDAVIIASTPESQRFPILRAALEEGKHVLIEKPVAPTLEETDEAIALCDARELKLAVGYTRRFAPKYAFINRAIKAGDIGDPVTCLVSRNITREIGAKIKGSSKMSPAAMGGNE